MADEQPDFLCLKLNPVWHNLQSARSFLHLESFLNIWGRGLKVPARMFLLPWPSCWFVQVFWSIFSKNKILICLSHPFWRLIVTPFWQLNGRWLRQCYLIQDSLYMLFMFATLQNQGFCKWPSSNTLLDC